MGCCWVSLPEFSLGFVAHSWNTCCAKSATSSRNQTDQVRDIQVLACLWLSAHLPDWMKRNMAHTESCCDCAVDGTLNPRTNTPWPPTPCSLPLPLHVGFLSFQYCFRELHCKQVFLKLFLTKAFYVTRKNCPSVSAWLFVSIVCVCVCTCVCVCVCLCFFLSHSLPVCPSVALFILGNWVHG